MIRVAITGVAGRMGRSLVQAGHQDKNIMISAASEHPDSPFIGEDIGVLAGVGILQVSIITHLAEKKEDFDLIIDFTRPEVSLAHLQVCEENAKPIVIGTTGFTSDQYQEIIKASHRIPIVFAPNMSVGVNLCLKLLEITARVLGKEADIEIIEAHHRHKSDSPSGTALRMGDVIAQELNLDLNSCIVSGQRKSRDEESKTIGFSSLRIGDTPGEHTVVFAMEGERVEISHKALNRMIFAYGAIRAANWVIDKSPGLYNMQNVLDFS
ncbi:4-hydroxy-tetrahydrodipicolinate reductase [Candidatus Nitrosacidococcus sp. I8]|uniref:4-hydroxy-tetrahydrodipicolinate reductase n=1 Tax=Candidatus Nitrosacidococcus sp. I8 TaxID=2942908 RepID=UPI00222676F1|nr:4-hydroxy-tetrahydrodipicolinate reductase [Candidatus Nitrosacidococcus sp. I8]CAH9015999.1 4-hydroxy-tetrahydrodipicolinate reductase [Candidatus Nitrosacidococcus sp. I8]